MFARKQRASAYERQNSIFISPSSLTEGGVWIASEPLVGLERRLTASEDIGKHLLAALSNSKVGVPHPSRLEWGAVVRPLLDLAGTETWGEFARGATLCEIERTGDIIRLVPTINKGAEEGFKLEREKATEVSAHSSPEALGGRLLEVLASRSRD